MSDDLMNGRPCEYCGADLPEGVDKRTRQTRSHHFSVCEARPPKEAAEPLARTQDQTGWLEAAIAWEVCASIHQTWAKGKDALFKTRHADFVKHAEDARQKAAAPPRQPLSASEIVTMYAESPRCDSDMIDFARAIERAHGIGDAA